MHVELEIIYTRRTKYSQITHWIDIPMMFCVLVANDDDDTAKLTFEAIENDHSLRRVVYIIITSNQSINHARHPLIIDR